MPRLSLLISATFLLLSQPAWAQLFSQQGPKLTASDAVGVPGFGNSVSISGDGNTAVVGGPGDSDNSGAVWVYARNGGIWTQQGGKLVGTGASGGARQGLAVALSADGSTALVGGPLDNASAGGGVDLYTHRQRLDATR